MTVDAMNKCLRSELSAIETYQQALEKFRAHSGESATFQELSQMLRDHREAASQLKALVERHGGTPSKDSGVWGAWSKTVMGAAKAFGDKAALKALKEGEESGLKEYALIAQGSGLADVESVAATLMARQQKHIGQLDRMIEAA